MAEGQESSFGQKVLRRAWRETWEFFDSTLSKAVASAIMVLLGWIAYYLSYGLSATKDQIVPILFFTVGPFLAFWALIFIWHLWLAPLAFTYEAARELARMPGLAPPPAPVVAWAPWIRRSQYSSNEFAAILANEDPSTQPSYKRMGFYRLILEEAKAGKLPTVRKRLNAPPGGLPDDFSIPSDAALKWAKDKGFDLSHFE